MYGQVSRGGGAAHGQALEDEAGVEPAQAQPVILLRGVEAAQTQRRRLLDGGDGEFVLPVPARGMGLERQIGEGTGRVDTGPLGFGQGKIHLVRFLVISIACRRSTVHHRVIAMVGVGGSAVDPSAIAHRRWMVMLGPVGMSSSNQRSVTVLVSV
ncbi:hypothetical protein D3C71_1694240 [compost metagenome]